LLRPATSPSHLAWRTNCSGPPPAIPLGMANKLLRPATSPTHLAWRTNCSGPPPAQPTWHGEQVAQARHQQPRLLSLLAQDLGGQPDLQVQQHAPRRFLGTQMRWPQPLDRDTSHRALGIRSMGGPQARARSDDKDAGMNDPGAVR